MRAVVPGLLLLLCLMGDPHVFATTIAAPIIPEEKLDRFGLKRDIQSLIGYLEHGLPPGHTKHDVSRTRPSTRTRFIYYQWVIASLQNLNDPTSVTVLRRIQAGELAPVIQADLDMHTAATPELTSWKDWDQYINLQRDRLAMFAALAIAELTGESPRSELESLLQKQAGHLHHIENEYLERSAFGLFKELCTYVSLHGSFSGIEILVACLESPHSYIRIESAKQLRQWTRLRFGPYPDSPFSTTRHDVNAWKMWWSDTKPVADLTQFHFSEVSALPLPSATTLYEHLWRAVENGHSRVTYADDSEAWLQLHAPAHSDSLRSIATDPTERLEIRAIALRYFNHDDKSSSYRLLLRGLQDSTTAYSNPLHRVSLDLIQGFHRKRYPDVLKQCIEENWPSAPSAIMRLANNPLEREYLLQILPTCTRDIQVSIVRRLLSIDEPPITVVELALAMDDPFTATNAIWSTRVSTTASVLSSTAQENLARWQTDSRCPTCFMAAAGDPSLQPDAFFQIMNTWNPTKPPSAAIYAMAIEHFGSQAVDGFVHAVEAYRVSHGRMESLAELGYR